MKLNCVAIDDEPPALNLVVSYIEKTPFLNLKGKFYNPLEALEFLRNEKVDVIFLDINMPDLNGLALSAMIPESCRVIFTTAYSEYALESYRVSALDYLLKPFGYEDFLRAARKAVKYFSPKEGLAKAEKPSDFFFIRAEYKQHRVSIGEILFIENIKDYVRFFFEDGSTLMPLMTLKSVEEKLANYPFMKVHRSFIVNLERVTTVERNQIVCGKHRVPVSNAFREKFQAFLDQGI